VHDGGLNPAAESLSFLRTVGCNRPRLQYNLAAGEHFARGTGGVAFNEDWRMGLFGFGKKEENLVVVTWEGPNRLRLNGNRKAGKEADAAKQGAKSHARTVVWFTFDMKGRRLDQGKGPSAERMPGAEIERMLRELPLNKVVLGMLQELEQGAERSAKILSWVNPNQTAKPT
jgi:hypothetical protein